MVFSAIDVLLLVVVFVGQLKFLALPLKIYWAMGYHYNLAQLISLQVVDGDFVLFFRDSHQISFNKMMQQVQESSRPDDYVFPITR